MTDQTDPSPADPAPARPLTWKGTIIGIVITTAVMTGLLMVFGLP